MTAKSSKKKGRMYISGPMSGIDEKVVIERFRDAKALLHEKGWKVFNPADPLWMEKLKEFELDYSEILAKDIARLAECDAIYMLKGWHESRGCLAELQFAHSCSIPIYAEDGAFDNIPKNTPIQVRRLL